MAAARSRRERGLSSVRVSAAADSVRQRCTRAARWGRLMRFHRNTAGRGGYHMGYHMRGGE